MKLIFCPKCTDLVRLFHDVRRCRCGESWGHYVDEVQAEIGGKAVAVGIDNFGFARAYRRVDGDNQGRNFSAWFMRPDEPHVTRVTDGVRHQRQPRRQAP